MLTLPVRPGLTIFAVQPGDADELFALTDANRPYLRRWLPWLDGCRTAADTRAFVDETLRQTERGRALLGVLREEGELIGVIGYNALEGLNRVGKIGYWLAKDRQGGGRMTAACRAWLEYGFAVRGLNRQIIAVAVENLASRAIPERLGLPLEGVAREAERLYDRYVDHAVYAITAAAWRRQHVPLAAPRGAGASDGGVTLRPLVAADLPAARALWAAVEGVGLSEGDSPRELAAYLARNPGASVAAENGAGELVGAALAGHDGRRGYLYHVSVRPELRGRGLGRRLVAHATSALAAEGIRKHQISVYAHNPAGQAFWRRLGWRLRDDLRVMQHVAEQDPPAEDLPRPDAS